jgi:ATP phosphoribosyltransferase
MPSLHAPTVNHLFGREWRAIETVGDSKEVRSLIPQLKSMGAEGILEYELKKMI